MTEEQIRAKAQDYKKKIIYSGSAETDAENGFIAGAMFVQQLLQQTDVSGALPLIEQEIDCAFKEWESKNEHLSDTDSWSFKNGAWWAENRLKGNDR